MEPKSNWKMKAMLDKDGNYTHMVVYDSANEPTEVDEKQEQLAWLMAQAAIVKAMRK